MSFQKTTAASASAVLTKAASSLRSLASRNAQLEQRNSFLEKQARCRDITERLHQRGIDTELEDGEKIAELMELPESELSAVEKAVDMVTPGGVKLASVSHTPGADGARPGQRLETFLMTGSAG